MAINLQKGQKVSLSKESPGLSKVIVGLGWDEAPQPKGLLSLFTGKQDIDCDASAILLKNGRLVNREDLVYFGNLKHKTGTVLHMGDNLTGAGEGDDEQIVIDLAHVPAEYDKIVIVVNIYHALKRHQHFGMIRNAFIRLVDDRTQKEICRYNLEKFTDITENGSSARSDRAPKIRVWENFLKDISKKRLNKRIIEGEAEDFSRYCK